MRNNSVLKKIKGDASFRNFYRKRSKDKTSIIVFAKKEKQKNLIIYDAINKILNKNQILAPKLYSYKYNKNFIEIQDFGNETIFALVKKESKKSFFYFKKIIKELNKIQAIKDKKIKTFQNKTYTIPKYEKKILVKEANLFCDWYAKKVLSKEKKSKFNLKFKKIVKKLSQKIKLKNDIFVHRDFHISNLMYQNNKIAIIDSQDALIGNKAYDLASLIDDVRYKTSKSFKQNVYKFYIKTQKSLDKKKFKNDFEIISVLRNLKVIGVFTRLAIRDHKKKYLKLIPYTWSLIKMRIKENKNFKELNDLLKQFFKDKMT
tara:strand:- start:1359 stop:2309 length:951 start_codon:yes stop_codon:yes gene_type:complete